MKGIIAAFAMYSKIPMPKTEWNKKNMRYAMMFFPLVGVVIGGMLWLWHWLVAQFNMAGFLFAAGATVLPLLLTGGLHMDGFIDTVDAWHCYGSPAKRRAVLKDPHVGALGVIWCSIYLLVVLGLWAQLYEQPRLIWLAAAGCFFSRALTALVSITEKTANQGGILHSFASNAEKKPVIVVLSAFLLIVSAVGIRFEPVVCMLLLLSILLVSKLCVRAARREFAGVSGDLAGFFLQIIELVILVAAAIGGVFL